MPVENRGNVQVVVGKGRMIWEGLLIEKSRSMDAVRRLCITWILRKDFAELCIVLFERRQQVREAQPLILVDIGDEILMRDWQLRQNRCHRDSISVEYGQASV
jgi:hypothetical protein